jgi:anti-anti-sigma factor
MALQIHVEQLPRGMVVLRLAGRLDVDSYQDCEGALMPLLTTDTRRLVLDLSGLEYISSMGLRVVLKAHKVMEGMGGAVALVNLQPPVKKVFEIAALLPEEGVFASIAEADRYLDAIQRKVREGTIPS